VWEQRQIIKHVQFNGNSNCQILGSYIYLEINCHDMRTVNDPNRFLNLRARGAAAILVLHEKEAAQAKQKRKQANRTEECRSISVNLSFRFFIHFHAVCQGELVYLPFNFISRLEKWGKSKE
jgi:hypothetical protein